MQNSTFETGLTLKYNACSVKPGSDINIKQRNPLKRVILYKHPYNDKITSISRNKIKFFLLCLQYLRGKVTNFNLLCVLSCFSENHRNNRYYFYGENQSNLMYTTDIHSNSRFAINLSGYGGQCQPPTSAGSDNGINNIFFCVVPPTWPPYRQMQTIKTEQHRA